MATATVTPFTVHDYRDRMDRAVGAAVEAGMSGGVLVTPGPDLVWLTGYQPTAITERLTVLVLSPQQEPTLLVPRLERPDAEAAPGVEPVTVRDWVDGTDPYEVASALVDPTGQYAISDSAWSMHLLGLQTAVPGARYRSITQCLPMLRAVKDESELARLALAGAAADATFGEIVSRRFAGRRETQVAADLAGLLRDFGHEQVDFTVVGSGPNGANPHHEAGERFIGEGDTVVLDFGGLMNGYGSDTTRTVTVGAATPEVAAVHEVVRQAQQAAFAAVRPGVACEEIDRVARDVITDAGYGAQFIHRTGHGIGVTTHEPPYMVAGERTSLQPGMCFSIEPGIYLEGRFGIRIEDIVTVTETGGQRFNQTDRALHVVA